MLEMRGLSKRYGDIQALDDCSFDVTPGRMLGFLGPNGAGKTTTMRAIFGLITLDAGSVEWKGRPVTPSERLAFGYMPEERGLYPRMKALDHLVYIGRLHGLDARAAQRAARDLLTELGLEDRLGDPIEQLSHGNQQRVQLAAALVHHPDLLVLDEPFAGLDPMGAETMASVLRARAEDGVTVVFSSHQLDVVEDLCEDVVVIHRGRVVLAGGVRELKAAAPIRRLEIELANGDAALIDSIDGVVSASFDGHRHTLLVGADTDLDALLERARRAGELRHFVFTTPSLSDLFREAVS
jgi:ABC-2 type transport system ATP-binding protein